MDKQIEKIKVMSLDELVKFNGNEGDGERYVTRDEQSALWDAEDFRKGPRPEVLTRGPLRLVYTTKYKEAFREAVLKAYQLKHAAPAA